MKKNKILNKYIKITLLSTSLILGMCSCTSNTGEASKTEQVSANIEEQTSKNDEVTLEPQMISDYRKIIDSINVNDATDAELNTLENCYEALRAKDSLEEADYAIYSNICNKVGENKLGYEILVEEYNVYPSEDVIERLQNYVVSVDDEETREIADSVKNQIDSFFTHLDCEGLSDSDLREIVTSSKWIKNLQFGEGILTKKSIYKNNDYSIQVEQQEYETRITILSQGKTYVYEYTPEIGSEIMEINGDGYAPIEGKITLLNYDETSNLSSKMKLNIKNGLVVGDFNYDLDTINYSGTFDDQGHTKNEQPENVDGYEIYAYDVDKETCLFIETEEKRPTFTVEYFDIPVVNIWEEL